MRIPIASGPKQCPQKEPLPRAYSIDHSNAAETMSRVFNLLISSNPTAWETDQLMSMSLERFKEYSGGPEADRVLLDKPESLKLLEGIPSLLAYESGVAGADAKVVRYGSLSEITKSNGNLTFRFTEEGRFPKAVFEEFADRLFVGDWEMNRTHWAVKEGGIPQLMLVKLQRTYDLVFSFAGEDRPYVQKVADYLKRRGVRVFYDYYEEASLWGKDLAEHFGSVYGKSGRHCVMFISKHYAEKMWTNHERQSALVRALQERGDYILPARFDDTEVLGIRPTVAFVTIAKRKPADFAKLLLAKLGRQD